eukprot:scaffold170055_cov30-Tisochrysis_lutea.AAC.4
MRSCCSASCDRSPEMVISASSSVPSSSALSRADSTSTTMRRKASIPSRDERLSDEERLLGATPCSTYIKKSDERTN